MEYKTHTEIAKLYCKITNSNPYRKKIIIESTMQPDYDKKYINKVLSELFTNNKSLENLANQYNTEVEPYIHDHKNMPYACIFFARLSKELIKTNVKLSCQSLSWAIHYFVDCATPIHERSLRGIYDYITGRHEKYENYIDMYFTKQFSQICEQGIEVGFKNEHKFTLTSAKNMAKNASSFYDDITKSLNNNNYVKLNKTTKSVFDNLGLNFARFINTFS